MRLVNADTVADDLKDLIKSGMYPSIIAEKFVPLVQAIQMLPRIEAEPVRRGRWVVEPGIGCWCSACGFDIGNELDVMEYGNYCPSCGALMEEK